MGPYPVAYHGVGDDAILSVSDAGDSVLTNCKEVAGPKTVYGDSKAKVISAAEII